MSTTSSACLRDVPFKITNPERIPSARYYDEAFFRLEREHFWPRVWQMACRLEEIPELGDWVEYRNLDQSVIVVRTRSGIKAFQNACRHRGVQLAAGHGNCKARGFICPFHGWRYNMDGENTFVYGQQIFSLENLEKGELNLVPCRVELWGGCAFINFDVEAAPLLECLGPSAEVLDARHVDQLKVEWWVSTVLPTNWKLAMEGFMEGYHAMRTHPQLHAVSIFGDGQYGPDAGARPAKAAYRSSHEAIESAVNHMEVLSAGMGGMVHANDIAIARELLRSDLNLPEDWTQAMGLFFKRWNEEITNRGRARGVPMPDLNELAANRPVSPVQYIFPHYFLLPQFGNMSSYRIRPLTPETCLFELWSLILYPKDEERGRPIAPTPLRHDDPGFPAIPRQDYTNLPLQQLGLHALGFKYMRLSKDIEGLISTYQRTLDGFLEGRSQNELLRAVRTSSSGIDVPIADIGF